MTKKETIRLHRELWNWLADNPAASKIDWPGWKTYNAVEHCFLCEYAERHMESGCCLLDWEDTNTCYDSGSLYARYSFCKELKLQSQLARQIANLKERK